MNASSIDLTSMDFAAMDDASIARFLQSHVHRPIPGSESGPNPVAVAMKPVFLRLMEKRFTPKGSEGSPDPDSLTVLRKMQRLQDAFLSREGPSKPSMLDLEQLRRRLTSYPQRLPDSDYLKDLDQKIPLVQQINQLCRQLHTDALMKELHLDKASFWSTLMTMDLERLEEVRRDLDDISSVKAKRLLLTDFPAWAMATAMLLRSLIQGYAKEPTRQWYPARPLGDMSEFEFARIRDRRRCIITERSLDSDVVHIIPLDLLRLRTHVIKQLEGMRSWYSDDRITALLKKLTSESCDENIINTRRNMICMDRTMDDHWYTGEFILKPMGRPVQMFVPFPAEDPAEEPQVKSAWVLTLIFHWLQKTEFPGMQQAMSFDTDPRQHFEDFDFMNFGVFNNTTAQPVIGGEIIRICAYNEEDLPDCDLLDLRANLYMAFSLAAAVDPRAFKFDDEKGGDEGDNEDDDFDEMIASRSHKRMLLKKRAKSPSSPRFHNTPSTAADESSHAQQDSEQVTDEALSPNEDGNKDTVKNGKTVNEIQSSTA
ncbi:Integral membrane protein [Colletotrichum scovillei]|uniref:Integral membrane protein n=1 Tax=Colletotrichum scovillei TaxID=1209932 RepID=A0A9P7RBG0_9PEZI|nr:Integral membrane protein [Colletotrichum scovillei]KAG7071752.1 Integral membrane protein [Colletotrichum scovillei]KAG7079971.1 Integral membrane protein [Colletotrichum scovillei]